MGNTLRQAEATLAALLTLASAWLHFTAARSAGALWRDESNTVALSTLPSVGDIWTNLQFDSFPLLWLLIIRGFASIAGPMNDSAFRALGFCIGLGVLGALWFSARTFRYSFPLLSLALLGLSPSLIVWGDSMRAYGFGIILILLAGTLLWRFVETPGALRFAVATAAAVASVHTLFYNSVLLLSFCAGAVAVCAWRTEWRKAGLVIVLGAVAALSITPYLVPVGEVTNWNMLVKMPDYSFAWFWKMLGETLLSGGFWALIVWVELFVFAMIAGVLAVRSPARLGLSQAQRDVALYSLVSLSFGAPASFLFLKALSYFTSPWYYLTLLALAGVCIDAIFGALIQNRVARLIRLVAVIVFAAFTLPVALRAVETRMTNVDLVASKLEAVADPRDVVVVTPWYVGVSFDRYYRGDTPWMTLPPVGIPRYHRYDLVKGKMTMADQTSVVRPVLDQAREALSNGHQVFIVGHLRFPSPGQQARILQPAPLADGSWPAVAYDQQWSAMLGHFLRQHASSLTVVPVNASGAVNPNETVDLVVAQGWRR